MILDKETHHRVTSGDNGANREQNVAKMILGWYIFTLKNILKLGSYRFDTE